MANTVNTFTLKLNDKDFQTALKDTAKYSKIYSEQTARSLIESAKLEEKKAKIQDKNLKLKKENTKASKEQIKVNNAEIRSLNTQIKAEDKKVKGLAVATSLLNKDTAATNRNTASKNKNAKSTENLANQTIRYLRWAGTIAGVMYAANRAWRASLGTGIEVNKMMEDNTSGIAALLSANTQMTLSNGQVVNSYEKFIIGQQVATRTMEDLRKASVKTYATFPQLTEIFQQAIGQTLSMGDAFGSTIDEINANTIKLAQRMSNIGGAIGQPMDRIREEIRSLLSGNASTDSLIATMLFGSPSEANKSIRMAKERGKDGLTELLDEILKPFDVLEDVDSYTRSMLQFQDAWSQTMAKMSEPVFEDLKVTFGDLAKSINKDSDEIVESFETIYEIAKDLIPTLGSVGLGVGAIRIAAMINPFTAWVTALASALVIAQDLTAELSQERFTKGVGGGITSTSGAITTTSPTGDIEAVLQSYEKQITARATLLLQAKEDSRLYDRHYEAITLINDEMIRLSGILDGTTKKQEDSVALMEEYANLQTKIPVDAKRLEEIIKENNKALAETLKLKEDIAENEKLLGQLRLQYSSITNEKIREKILKNINKVIQNTADKEKKIAEIKQKAFDDEVKAYKKIGDLTDKAFAKTIKNQKTILDKLREESEARGEVLWDQDFTKGIDDADIETTFEDWGKTLNSSISNALVDAIRDGDVLDAVQGLGASISASMIQSSVANIGAGGDQLESAGGLMSMGGIYGIAAGVGLSAVSSLFGGGLSAEEKAQKSFDKFIDGLDDAGQALRDFGNIGTEISTTITSIQDELLRQRGIVAQQQQISASTGGITSSKERKAQKEIELLSDELLTTMKEDLASALSFEGFDESQLKAFTGIDDINTYNKAVEEAKTIYNDTAIEIKKLQQVGEEYDGQIDELALSMIEMVDSSDDILVSNRNNIEAIKILNDLETERTSKLEEEAKLISDQNTTFSNTLTLLEAKDDTERLAITRGWELNAIDDVGNRLLLEQIHTQQDLNALLAESNANIATWTQRNETAQDTAERLAKTLGIDLAQSLNDLDVLADNLTASNNALTNEELALLRANEAYLTSIGEITETVVEATMSMLDAQGIIEKDILRQWREAENTFTSLSKAFGDISESIEDTIATLLGGSDALDAQDRLIESFWDKQGQVDVLLAKEGDLTQAEASKLSDLIGDINQLSQEIQKSSIGDNTKITNELVNELGLLSSEIESEQKSLTIQDTIESLIDTSINYLGPDSDIVTWLQTLDGTLNSIDFATYKAQIEAQKAYDLIGTNTAALNPLGLSMEDLKAEYKTDPSLSARDILNQALDLGLIDQSTYNTNTGAVATPIVAPPPVSIPSTTTTISADAQLSNLIGSGVSITGDMLKNIYKSDPSLSASWVLQTAEDLGVSFARGGDTPKGLDYQFGGIVHRNEHILNAPTLRSVNNVGSVPDMFKTYANKGKDTELLEKILEKLDKIAESSKDSHDIFSESQFEQRPLLVKIEGTA